MKILIDWIPDSLLQAMGWTLVHSLWQLLVIASLLWLVLKIISRTRPAVKYGLSVGALGVSLMMSVGTFIYEYRSTGVSGPMLSNTELQLILANPSFLQAEIGIESGIDEVSFWIEQNIPLLVNFWFLGALLFLFRLVNSLSEIRNLRKSSSPVADLQLQRVLYRMAGKMGIDAEVRLRVSVFGSSPLTFGTFKPVILFPAGLLFQLSPTQLEAIIAHELAHVKRNDYLANLLLSGLEVVFFYHPCYWWMNSTVKELRENAADDLVMKAGIEPRSLATSLAEVLNFAKQNPPELAMAASKRRNPTLQRIKRILGYPSQNYPQTPIISIPMLLTLFLSVGLMASAQQDAPNNTGPVKNTPVAGLESTFSAVAAQDTVKKTNNSNSKAPAILDGGHTMVFTSDEGKTYRIQGDLLISGDDTVKLSPKAQAALDNLQAFDNENMPQLNLPTPPVFPEDMVLAPMPAIDFDMTMPVMAPIPPMDMAAFPVPVMDFDLPVMPEMDMNFAFDANLASFIFAGDTTEMTKGEREKWAKERNAHAEEWAKKAEEASRKWESKFEKEFQPKLREFEARMEEWQAANGPKIKEFEAKVEEWQAANGPKMEEFEAKMNEWQAANGPKIKEFEQKMEEWKASQGPKMEEFERKMKEWETAQKPKMEEFQRQMDVWQKEHQSKVDEFEKLLKEELKKDNN